MAARTDPFDRYGPLSPASPVVLSVAHAGRDYPLPLRSALRVPPAALAVFEDRFVDAVAIAARRDEIMFVQRHARAWIDLNRAETDRDPAIEEGARKTAVPLLSAKLRSGLGLVPRRVPGHGDAWRRRFSGAEIEARIVSDHRPYHAALGEALAAAQRRFGVAVLLDIHSMPTIEPAGSPQIVVGDRFGRTASARLVHLLERIAADAGLRHALNAPYAGGHILDRHGCVANGVHAIQLEIDRALYLDVRRNMPGPGLTTIAGLLRVMIDALADEAIAAALPIAAE